MYKHTEGKTVHAVTAEKEHKTVKKSKIFVT